MSWQSAVLERISQIERDTVAEVDQLVQTESSRLRTAIETEQSYLHSVLEETAREIAVGGELAAARATHKALEVADGYRGRDPARATRAEWVAMGVHDQIRAAADALAEQVKGLEPNLAAPLIRARREATNDALPNLKRIVEEAAHRTAGEQRRSLARRIHPPEEEIEAWRRQMIDAVRQVRTSAKDKVDGTHRRARAEIERLVEELASVPGPVRKRLMDIADQRVEQAVRAASEGRRDRQSALRVWLGRLGLVFAVLVVFVIGVMGMGTGIGFAGAAVGAVMLRGAAAPPVMGGLLMGIVGTTFGAMATDLVFNRLADWRRSVSDSVLGAVSPLDGPGQAAPARELARALQYVELPPLSPDRVAASVTPGALRVSVRAGDPGDAGEVTGKSRIPTIKPPR
ncbi:MAG: hypothetical protein R3F59_28150 [Myxococcota bacterium]